MIGTTGNLFHCHAVKHSQGGLLDTSSGQADRSWYIFFMDLGFVISYTVNLLNLNIPKNDNGLYLNISYSKNHEP